MEFRLGEKYYLADPTLRGFYIDRTYDGSDCDEMWNKRGLMFTTKDDAVKKSKRMIGVFVDGDKVFMESELVEANNDVYAPCAKNSKLWLSGRLLTMYGELYIVDTDELGLGLYRNIRKIGG